MGELVEIDRSARLIWQGVLTLSTSVAESSSNITNNSLDRGECLLYLIAAQLAVRSSGRLVSIEVNVANSPQEGNVFAAHAQNVARDRLASGVATRIDTVQIAVESVHRRLECLVGKATDTR